MLSSYSSFTDHFFFLPGWELQNSVVWVLVQLEVNHIVGYKHHLFSKEAN